MAVGNIDVKIKIKKNKHMKKITFLLFITVSIWSINAQNKTTTNPTANVLLNEDFNHPILPAGWTINDNSTGGAGPWTFVAGWGGYSLDGTPFAIIDSDGYGEYITEDTELVSPVIDVSGLSNVFISFDQFFNTLTGNDVADVDVFDGTNWVNIYTTSVDAGNWFAPDNQLIDVTAYKNTNFKLRFHYHNGNDELWWAIDNVKVFAPYTNDMTAIKSLTLTDAYSGIYVPNKSFTLKAEVFNFGLNEQNDFDVIFDIKDSSNTSVFNETVHITNAKLKFYESGIVTSTNQPNLPVGNYTLDVTVRLTGDQDPTNDTFSTPLNIVDFPNTYNLNTVYSYDNIDYDDSGDEGNVIAFDVNSGAPTSIGHAGLTIENLIAHTFVAGIFMNGALAAVEEGTNKLYYIDGTNGKTCRYGTFTGDVNDDSDNITGIAFDNASQTGYVCTWENFYTFDQNLHTTLVGPMNNEGIMIGITVDNNGDVYGIDMADSSLYKINPSTGISTVIGDLLDVSISDNQDIGIDPVTGNLYGVFYRLDGSGSGLFSINKNTGAATPVGTLVEDEYTVCAIKGTTVSISENNIAGLKVYPNPTNGMIAVNAQENIQNIAIVNLAGQVVKTFDNNDLNTQLDVSDLTAGNYILKITTDKTVGSYQIIKR